MASHQYYRKKCTPTVVPATHFDSNADAHALHNALKGVVTNNTVVIEILAHRDIVQRLEIADTYKTLFGQDLVNEFKSSFSGHFQDAVVALMTPLPKFYAKELHDAIQGLGTNEEAIVEILCTLSNFGIRTVAAEYENMYKTTLEKDLVGDTSGHFRKLCVSLCQGNRLEDLPINSKQAKADAATLHKAGEARWGTDEPTFNRIMVTNSYEQLKEIFIEYEKLTGHEIEVAIEGEFSGSIKKGHMAIVKCARNKVGFFAERLYYSMKGLGTSDKTLIRIIVGRCEIDLGDIKRTFEEKYGATLESFVKDDTSRHYRTLLLELIG